MTEHAHTLSLSLFISSSLFHSLFPSSSQSVPAGTLLITNVVKIALMPLMCVYLFIFSNILRLSIRGLIFSIFLYQLLVVHCRQYYYNIVTTVHYCWCPSPFSSFSSIFFSLLLSHAAAEYRISNRIGLLSFVFFSSFFSLVLIWLHKSHKWIISNAQFRHFWPSFVASDFFWLLFFTPIHLASFALGKQKRSDSQSQSKVETWKSSSPICGVHDSFCFFCCSFAVSSLKQYPNSQFSFIFEERKNEKLNTSIHAYVCVCGCNFSSLFDEKRKLHGCNKFYAEMHTHTHTVRHTQMGMQEERVHVHDCHCVCECNVFCSVFPLSPSQNTGKCVVRRCVCECGCECVCKFESVNVYATKSIQAIERECGMANKVRTLPYFI